MRSTILFLACLACSGDGGGTDTPTGSGTGATTGGTTGGSTGATTGVTTGSATGTTSALSLEIGNGVDAHAPLSPTDQVLMVHGPQSGWHVEVSGLVSGVGDTVLIKVHMETLDGVEQTDSTENFYLLADYDSKADSGVFVDQRAFVGTTCHDDHKICELGGGDIRLCATVSSVADPALSITACAEATALLDASDGPLCDAIADDSWYAGWPMCELVPECTVQVDPCCGDNPPATCTTSSATTSATSTTAP